MIQTSTVTLTIWLGLKVRSTGRVHSIDTVKRVVQEYVDRVGQCFSVSSCDFIYKNGSEPGARVGMINYGRFPSTNSVFMLQCVELAKILAEATAQLGVTVESSDGTTLFLQLNQDFRYLPENA